MARVLKAKYYRRTDFLNARCDLSPSYIWRSIIYGKELLHQGLRWRIGDGHAVRVFQDPWLPAPGSFKPIASLRFLQITTTVADLIHHGVWREDLLQVLFCQRDKELITNIPLSPDGGKDELIWHYTPTGRFTVSSAYLVGIQSMQLSMASCSTVSSDWLLLWMQDLPPKVFIFAWQLCHNSLATGLNLTRRRIKASGCCPRCPTVVEDDHHLFFHCPFAKLVWRESHLFPYKLLSAAQSWLQFFQIVAEHSPEHPNLLSKIIICLWGIWRARNDLIFNHKNHLPQRIATTALDYLSSFQVASPDSSVPKLRGCDHPTRWLPPANASLKLNTDGSFLSNRAGYGFVLRNHEGRVLKSGSGPLLYATSAEHAEVMALRKSLENIQEFWSHDFSVELDCQKVVDQLHSVTQNMSALGAVIESLKCFLRRIGVENIHFSPRVTNSAAHSLAKIGLSIPSDVIWFNSSHPLVLDVLQTEWSPCS